MWGSRLFEKKESALGIGGRPEKFLPSGGEIHYLYWYMQGSIMVPSVRDQLRRAWGFCERHAWAAIYVEASFRHGYFHGPAILYRDLLSRALPAFRFRGPGKELRLGRHLREKGACIMCEMRLGPKTAGMANPEIVERGQDPTELKRFARKTQPHWQRTICGRCAGTSALERCRPHLLEDLGRATALDLRFHRSFLESIFHHLRIYERSFRYEFQDTETDEDTAALISAVGWCSGWRPFLTLMGIAP